MPGMRTRIQSRCSGRLLTVCLACLLAVQALIASVGLGMSAASPFGQPAFDICSAAAADGANAPARDDNDKPQCPFCFVAAQSAGHLATAAHVKAYPAFAVREVAAPAYADTSRDAVPGRLHRTTGDPRGPPSYSV